MISWTLIIILADARPNLVYYVPNITTAAECKRAAAELTATFTSNKFSCVPTYPQPTPIPPDINVERSK